MESQVLWCKLYFVLFIFMSPIEACEDVKHTFKITSNPDFAGKNRSCQWVKRVDMLEKCQVLEVIEACPSTCRKCNDLQQLQCTDVTGRFKINGDPHVPGRKKCKWVQRRATDYRCRTYLDVRINCPETCGEPCDSSPSVSPSHFICEDFGGRFSIPGQVRKKKCSWVRKKRSERCAMGDASTYCPVTCLNCPNSPSAAPSLSAKPSKEPSKVPSQNPTRLPSVEPTRPPSPMPSPFPTLRPTSTPSSTPSDDPSSSPTRPPSPMPSPFPTLRPTSTPSSTPSDDPSSSPSDVPSKTPSITPSSLPSSKPSSTPSSSPSKSPSSVPSKSPSDIPSSSPSDVPSKLPSSQPSGEPSSSPSDVPSKLPSSQPSDIPSVSPSSVPSSLPSSSPSSQPSSPPSDIPSKLPSSQPSGEPSSSPSKLPSSFPSAQPSDSPSVSPSSTPSATPSSVPSSIPTSSPTDCEDEPNWQSGGSHPFLSGLTCLSFGDLTSWCVALAGDSFAYSGKTVDEACCTCGGSRFQSDAPSATPSISNEPTMTASNAPSVCVDLDGWLFLQNPDMGCTDLESDPNTLCPITIGLDNTPATDACCVCKECADDLAWKFNILLDMGCDTVETNPGNFCSDTLLDEATQTVSSNQACCICQ